jgi:mRNA-degrading endonuclease RelE of RelBE toxin-antitoxin system
MDVGGISLAYEIIFMPEAREDILALRAHERKKVLDAIEIHLRYEPEKVSKSRIKRLKEMESPQYRLRIDDIRAFYDVWYETASNRVEILAVKEKAEVLRWLAAHGRRSE